jgi:DNA-binding transcriptional ArsR family regulator
MTLAHNSDPETGAAMVTYRELEIATGLSRAKISSGLDALEAKGVIERRIERRRSTYRLIGMAKSGWGAIPAKKLYAANGEIVFLQFFSLRKSTELHALRLYFLFVARRDVRTNLANISYDKIEEYTGIPREQIRSGISFLVTHGMIQVDYIPSGVTKFGVSNAYRITHLFPYQHLATSARAALEMEDVPF